MTQAQIDLGDAVETILSGKSLAELRTIKTEADRKGWIEVGIIAATMICAREHTMEDATRIEQEAIVARLRAEMGLA